MSSGRPCTEPAEKTARSRRCCAPADIRYVGSHPEAAGLAWSKPTAKVLVSRAGIATPAWLALPNGDVP